MKSVIIAFILSSFVSGYLELVPNIPVFVVSFAICMILSYDKKANIKKKTLTMTLCALCFCFGIFYNSFYIDRLNKACDDFIHSMPQEISGVVSSDVKTYNEESNFYIKTKNGIIIKVKCNTVKDIYIGEEITIKNPVLHKISPENKVKKVNVRLLGERCLIYTEVGKENLIFSGVSSQYKPLYFADKLKRNTFYNLLKYMKYEEAGLAQAIFTSDTTHLPYEIYNMLITTGTIHIATVSGFHFAVLGSLLLLILKLFFINHRNRIIVLSIIMIGFAFYTGLSIPVLRALLAFLVINICDLIRVKHISTKTVFLVLMGLFILISSTVVFDISFILTLVSNGAIVFFCTPVNRIQASSQKAKWFPVNTVVVILIMTPFVYSIFGRISVTSIVASYLVDFTMGAILILTGLISIFSEVTIIPMFLSLFLRIILNYFLFIISAFSRYGDLRINIPFDFISALFLTVFVIAVCYLFSKNNRIRNIVISICALFCFAYSFITPYFSDEGYITFFGQNEKGILISKNNHHIIMCDTSDLYYSSTSAVMQNEIIDLWIVTGNINIDAIKEHQKTYNIKEIIIHKNNNIKENIENTIIIDEGTIKYNLKDIYVTINSDVGNVLYVLLEYGNEKIYLTNRLDFLIDVIGDLENCSVILNYNLKDDYSYFVENINPPNSVNIYSEKYGNIISPYELGIISEAGLEFK